MKGCVWSMKHEGKVQLLHARLDEAGLEQQALRFLAIAEPEEGWSWRDGYIGRPVLLDCLQHHREADHLVRRRPYREADSAVRLQDPIRLRECTLGVQKMPHSKADSHCGEAFVGKWQILRVADAELQPRKDASRLVDHRNREIDAGDIRAAPRGGGGAVAGAAGDVEKTC